MKRTAEETETLETSRLLFDPELVIQRVRNPKEIWQLRHVLKRLRYDSRVLEHLAQVIRSALERRERFRVLDCIKVLRAQVRAAEGQSLSRASVENMFEIYRRLVLVSGDEVQWCVSRLIKDQPLAAEEINWLIENWAESEHVVNRLLLYPVIHLSITSWAAERYQKRELQHRQSELLALLLSSSKLEDLQNEDPQVLAWAVCKSKLLREEKLRLVVQFIQELPAHTVVQIAERLNSPDPVLAALRAGRNGGV